MIMHELTRDLHLRIYGEQKRLWICDFITNKLLFLVLQRQFNYNQSSRKHEIVKDNYYGVYKYMKRH